MYNEHWNVNTKFEILLMNCFILNAEGSTALQRILKNKVTDLLLDGSFAEICALWVGLLQCNHICQMLGALLLFFCI